MKIKTQFRQSIWDLALRYYGSPEGVFLLIEDNPDKIQSIDDTIPTGTVLYILQPPINRAVVAAAIAQGVEPANDLTDAELAEVALGEPFNPSLREDFSYELGEDGSILMEE